MYGQINSETGMRGAFAKIRQDIVAAASWAQITKLYRRAGYLIMLTYAPSWQGTFGREDATALREIGENEFGKTAKEINHRAAQIGTKANYNEKWGHNR
jgi:hypothetical protein